MERAQHAGDVAQRRALDPALADGAGRLALEVDDHEVLARPQHLPEVVVAVHAHADVDERGVEQSLEALEHLALALEQRGAAGEVAAATAERREDLPGERAHRLVERTAGEQRERLGREGRLVDRVQRRVQLGGALPEHARRLEVAPDRLVGELGAAPAARARRASRPAAAARRRGRAHPRRSGRSSRA